MIRKMLCLADPDKAVQGPRRREAASPHRLANDRRPSHLKTRRFFFRPDAELEVPPLRMPRHMSVVAAGSTGPCISGVDQRRRPYVRGIDAPPSGPRREPSGTSSRHPRGPYSTDTLAFLRPRQSPFLDQGGPIGPKVCTPHDPSEAEPAYPDRPAYEPVLTEAVPHRGVDPSRSDRTRLSLSS